MKSELTFIPTVSIHPDKICVYKEVNWSNGRPSRIDPETGEMIPTIKHEHLLNSSRSAEGKVSDQARRKIGKAIDYLLLLAKPQTQQAQLSGKMFQFRIAFITLTLPSAQIHDDNTIKSKCLNSFLLELKQYYNVKNYIWRAEKQGNGNLHFHILLDRFIPWSELRDRWNRIINKLGYVDRYQQNMKEWHKHGFKVRKDLLNKWDYEHQLHAYQTSSKTGFNNPNSTDIHSIKKIKNIKQYVAKYMSKQIEEKLEEIQTDDSTKKQIGRIWGCNYDLSTAKGVSTEIDWETSETLTKLVNITKCRFYLGDYFQVYYLTVHDLFKNGATELFKLFESYMFDHFKIDYQLTF